MKRILHFTVFPVVLLTLFVGCSSNDPKKVTPSPDKLEEIDKTFVAHIKHAEDETAKNTIWRGYDYSTFPQYFIYRDKNKQTKRGLLINPHKTISGATRITDATAKDVAVFRYDAEMAKLSDDLKKGNDLFTFSYKVSGSGYYGQVYDDEGIAYNGSSSIELAVHEVFHKYQDKWKSASGHVQDEANYPINNQLLPLQLLTMEIAKRLPAETNQATLDDYLAMYVAIRSEEIKLDTSPKKLVKNMANWQENYEGTAKYVEYMVSKDLFSDFAKSFEVTSTESMKTKSDMRGYFAWGIWYYTGASVTHLLKSKGVNVEAAVEEGKTLYDLASETLNLTDAQKAVALQKAKDVFGWSNLVTESNRLLAL